MVTEEFQANPERKRRGETLPRRFRSGFAGALLALTAFFLFAHGCHGPDEDHEPSVAPVKNHHKGTKDTEKAVTI